MNKVRFGAPLLAFGMGFFPMFWSYRLSATHFHQGGIVEVILSFVIHISVCVRVCAFSLHTD